MGPVHSAECPRPIEWVWCQSKEDCWFVSCQSFISSWWSIKWLKRERLYRSFTISMFQLPEHFALLLYIYWSLTLDCSRLTPYQAWGGSIFAAKGICSECKISYSKFQKHLRKKNTSAHLPVMLYRYDLLKGRESITNWNERRLDFESWKKLVRCSLLNLGRRQIPLDI